MDSPQPNGDGLDDVARKVEETLNIAGYETINPKEFFDGIDKLYRQPSLTQVIKEETPVILGHDSQFFLRYDIKVPEKPEVALFDFYYSDHGRNELERVYNTAKVWFRHLRFFSIDEPNQEELFHAVDEFKKIIEGKYFTSEPAP